MRSDVIVDSPILVQWMIAELGSKEELTLLTLSRLELKTEVLNLAFSCCCGNVVESQEGLERTWRIQSWVMAIGL